MKKPIILLVATCLLTIYGCKQNNETTPQTATEENIDAAVGQSSVVDESSNPNIVQTAATSKDHTTLVAAVKAAGLVDVLSNAGPFTVFAPTNAAFDKLPKGTVESLLKPENKKMLQSVLTYHVVSGKMNAADIAKAIKAGKGKAVLTTVQGGKLTAWMEGKDLYITDENGAKAKVTIADVNQSNGVIHVVDHVVTPKA